MAKNKVVYNGTTLIDLTDTTATAADVASGKYFYGNDGVKTLGTASGGGGASNVVTGTFKGTTTGAAMDVTLNYSGSGWPIALTIYPTTGIYNNSGEGSFYTLVQRYVCACYTFTKNDPSVEPSYASTNSNKGRCSVMNIYKSSTSSSTSMNGGTYVGSNGVALMSGADATGNSAGNILRFKTKNKMSVFIASTSYGFAANIEYTYQIIYSS